MISGMTSLHPLDRPVWNALNTGWAYLSQGDGLARRLDPDFGPFAALADSSPDARAALADVCPDNGEIWVVEEAELGAPPGMVTVRTAALAQMVADELSPVSCEEPCVDLTGDDAEAMRALADLTKPGPFARRTHELGGFVGIKQDGRLIAMAGERMRLPGFPEVSGVCTHPDARGRGLAGALMSVVMSRMIARGETPFLHSYASNAGAIALYERLGFRTRKAMTVTVLAPSPAA